MSDKENQAVEATTAPTEASVPRAAVAAAPVTASNSAINSQVPLPHHFATSGDLAAQWKKYKQLWDSFEIVTDLKSRDSEYRTATLHWS